MRNRSYTQVSVHAFVMYGITLFFFVMVLYGVAFYRPIWLWYFSSLQCDTKQEIEKLDVRTFSYVNGYTIHNYQKIEYLMKILSLKDATILLQHPNTIVRIAAYQTCLKNEVDFEYLLLKQVFEDNGLVSFRIGDVEYTQSIAEFMVYELALIDESLQNSNLTCKEQFELYSLFDKRKQLTKAMYSNREYCLRDRIR